MEQKTYEEFLETKRLAAVSCGFAVKKEDICPKLYEWQQDIVIWALKKGRAALFELCGAGKTGQQLEWAHHVALHTGKPVLVLCPLSVAEQTRREAVKFGIPDVKVVRRQDEVINGINVTNYEILNHFDCSVFGGVVVDESSCIKNFSGTLRNEIIDSFKYTPYRLSCTATPAPNDYMELGNQAEFLGVMSRTEMLATYFIHDGGETSKWRLKGHAQDKFWEWMASWACVLTNPSDLGYDGTDYVLPPLNTYQHTVKYEENLIGDNYSLFAGIAETLNDRREARRNSLTDRCQLAADIVAEKLDESFILWTDLNAEADELKRIIPGSVEVRGTDSPEYKSEQLNKFALGQTRVLITKSLIAGYGMNFQTCHNMIFVGISDSWENYFQSVRRCWRYGQEHEVNVHIITSEAEGAVKDNIERKEKQAAYMIAEMVKYTKSILEEEIRGTVRISTPYNPQIIMELPDWLVSA